MKFVIILQMIFYSIASTIFYITPDLEEDNNCTVNGTSLHPCYTVNQLINSRVYSRQTDDVELIFLPGEHVIPENQTLSSKYSSKLYLHPWSAQQLVVIECRVNATLYFSNKNLIVFSLHFKYCKFLLRIFWSVLTRAGSSVYIGSSIFEGSWKDYAIEISYFSPPYSEASNATISGCKFLLNNGAIIVNYGRNYFIDEIFRSHLLITHTKFIGNWRKGKFAGGALRVESAILEMSFSQFKNNTGGAIQALNSFLKVNKTEFVNNHGSSISSQYSDVNVDNCSFINNSAKHGTVKKSYDQTLILFKNDITKPLKISGSTFQGNRVSGRGGAVSIFSENPLFDTQDYNTITGCQFKNNSAQLGGALYFHNIKKRSISIFNSTFAFNRAENGGAINCNNSHIFIGGGHSFSNSAESGNGGFAYLMNSYFSSDNTTIEGGKASNGGAVYATNSEINIYNVSMVGNTAKEQGGALYLTNSFVYLDSALVLVNNIAGDRGGAVFVSDYNCEQIQYPSQCFLRDDTGNGSIVFLNNSSPVIYGGLLDRCVNEFSGLGGISYVKSILNSQATPLDISSDPVRVCICDSKGEVTCNKRHLTVAKMRGEAIDLMVGVVDQDENPKASFVRAGYLESNAELDKGEARRTTRNVCTELNYHVYTISNAATLILQTEGNCERSQFSQVTVNVTVVPCSRGLERYNDRCLCERRLLKYSVVCHVGTNSIQRKGQAWLSYGEYYLKVHSNCPSDYCNFTSDTISLTHPDEQCANHRSGVLCGACQDSYSIALGGSRCLHCPSNYTLAWLIPVFAVAGLALVALLLLLNMTISHGTLNGLIFYANVISISRLTSLQNCSIHPVLSVFIAWINLDLGVETCFYSGMDAYQKTWLQFAFPLYVWLLVGAIILASYYSSTAMRVFGRNNVAILATLFLLSYSKILKTITTALTFTTVLQGSAGNSSDTLKPYKVWTPDGNIEYLTGKHVPLFAVALVVLIFLFLPYTHLLTFGQCLRSLPVRRRCVLKIIRSTAFISIMDAYHAPYSKRHRYWTGLTLLTRCVLFLAFASGYSDRKLLVNMYVTTLVLVGVFVIKMTCSMNTYKHFYLNLLELCFLLNLVILSATLSYLGGNSRSDSKICKCTSASISVSAAMFVGILAYHAVLKLGKNRQLTTIFKNHFLKKRSNSPTTATKMPTTTNIQLREALLASDLSV